MPPEEPPHHRSATSPGSYRSCRTLELLLCGAVLCGVVPTRVRRPEWFSRGHLRGGRGDGFSLCWCYQCNVEKVMKAARAHPRWPRVGGHCWSERPPCFGCAGLLTRSDQGTV